MITPDDTSSHPAPPLEAIAHFDPIGAIDLFFRQVAHRALSLAIWLLVARVVFACWPRSFDFTFYILPTAFACIDIALAAVFMSLWFASRSRHDPREPRTMLWVSLVLLLPTVAWMLLPRLLKH
jgi:hypothetical protein